jgi:hypothetical protein
MALVGGLLYGIPMGLFFSYQSGGYLSGMTTGILAGLMFGPAFTWFMRRFVQKQTTRFNVERPDFGDESVLIEGPANHFKGLEGVGGYLWVTNRRVHFASHKINIQVHTWTVSLDDIRSVQAVKTFGLIDNGLTIETASCGKERFVVNNSNKWAQIIRSHTTSAS